MPAKVDHKKVDHKLGRIYIGIGGWNFAPWRGVFYPKGLRKPKNSNMRRAISLRSRSTRPSTARRSRKASANGRRLCPTVLCFPSKDRALPPTGVSSPKRATASSAFWIPACSSFGDRLGPMLWQFAPTKKFDARRFRKIPGIAAGESRQPALRHVVEVRHASFWHAGLRGACAALRHAGRVHRSRALSVARRRDRRFHLCAAAKRPRHHTDGLSAARSSTPGPNACGLGRKATRRMICRRSIRHRAEKSRAARRLRLCHSRRQNPRAGGSDGVDRALEVGEWRMVGSE